jgi:hypothetical protein
VWRALYAKEIMVEHSKATRILAYVCALILLPVYVTGPISLIILTLKRFHIADKPTVIFLVFLSVGMTYLCGKYFYLLVRFIKTIKKKVTFDDNGVVIENNAQVQKYSWYELRASREYPSCQIFCLIDAGGQHLFSIWEYANGYREFRQKMHEEVGI